MGFIFYILAIIAFALVMPDTEVIGLAGIRLLAAGLVCLCIASASPIIEPFIRRPSA